jgi:membrane protein required for colicin V production
MAWIDLFIIVVVVISALISLIRGFVKESISLVTWVAAGTIALRYYAPMADLLQPFIDSVTLRQWVGGGILFLVTLIVGAIVNYIVSQLVSKTGLSGTDKALGVVFGAARGLLIVTMMVLLASLTPMPEADWWRESILVDSFQQMAGWVTGVIPTDAVDKLSF